jgi:hypothetical protein
MAVFSRVAPSLNLVIPFLVFAELLLIGHFVNHDTQVPNSQYFCVTKDVLVQTSLHSSHFQKGESSYKLLRAHTQQLSPTLSSSSSGLSFLPHSQHLI